MTANILLTGGLRVSVRKVLDSELIRPPLVRQLATGKRIVVFNVVSSSDTQTLNTGSRIDYQNEIYEIMNRESVTSPILDYVKFNCVPVPVLSTTPEEARKSFI